MAADVTIDHISLSVSNYAKAKKFYSETLKPLGMSVMMEFPTEKGGNAMGLGKVKPILWIAEGGKTTPRAHFAFTAASRGEVDAFYAAAMASGGKDNGPPGIRPHYHENYYAAYVLDPDGNNIEAVTHQG
jgi:catechol 2,3-dioxygenase-like lactoylglutathione lyase family enzyme